MNKQFILSIILLLALFFSCGTSEKTSTFKADTGLKVLKGEKLSIENLFLMPSQINVSENLIIVIDEGREGIFSLINSDDEKLITSYGEIGDSPSSFKSTPIIQREIINKNNKFLFTEMTKGTIYSIDLNLFKDEPNNSIELNSSLPNTIRILDGAIKLSDTKICSKTSNSNGLAFIFDTSLNKTIYIAYPDFLFSESNSRYNDLIFKSYSTFNAKRNRIAFALEHFDNLLLYDSEANLIRNIQPTDYQLNEFFRNSESPTDENTVLHYIDIFSTEDYLYGLYLGKADAYANKNPQKLKMEVRKFDWEGSLIEVYKLDKPLISFAVDESKEIIYGINPIDEEYPLYKFSILK
jgi:hypothetical protein